MFGVVEVEVEVIRVVRVIEVVTGQEGGWGD